MLMFRRFFLALALSFLALGTVPGCGGPDDAARASVRPLTGNDWAWVLAQGLNVHVGITTWAAGTYIYHLQTMPTDKWKRYDSISMINANNKPTAADMASTDWELR